MNKSRKITVNDIDIHIVDSNNADYISLTDLCRGEDGQDHIRNWMRNRNTVEFLGLWETINNPKFKGVEFDTFRKEAGLNSFNLTPRKWIEGTGAVGIVSKAGSNGGTYAHKDIALEFCTWLNPLFKLLVLKEFQRLKEEEQKRINPEWDIRRYLAKANYVIHTDAVKNYIIPECHLPKNRENAIYAEEADVLNIAVFGYTAKQWRDANPKSHLEGRNLRDEANVHQLIVLSNMESMNAKLISDGVIQSERLIQLCNASVNQLESLQKSSYTLDKISSPFLSENTTKTRNIPNTDSSWN